jgi:hypothetical protein
LPRQLLKESNKTKAFKKPGELFLVSPRMINCISSSFLAFLAFFPKGPSVHSDKDRKMKNIFVQRQKLFFFLSFLSRQIGESLL